MPTAQIVMQLCSVQNNMMILNKHDSFRGKKYFAYNCIILSYFEVLPQVYCLIPRWNMNVEILILMKIVVS
jgi:hypothetical protein